MTGLSRILLVTWALLSLGFMTVGFASIDETPTAALNFQAVTPLQQ